MLRLLQYPSQTPKGISLAIQPQTYCSLYLYQFQCLQEGGVADQEGSISHELLLGEPLSSP